VEANRDDREKHLPMLQVSLLGLAVWKILKQTEERTSFVAESILATFLGPRIEQTFLQIKEHIFCFKIHI
jgi:hypothetical protein